MQVFAAIFDDDDAVVDGSIHITFDAALSAGAKLARLYWTDYTDAEMPTEAELREAAAEESTSTPTQADVDFLWMESLRGSASIHLEVEELEITPDTIRALFAQLKEGE